MMTPLEEKTHNKKRLMLLDSAFNHYAKYGLFNTNLIRLAKDCGFSSGSMYTYFNNLDELIVDSVMCKANKLKVEFAKKLPETIDGLYELFDKAPYWMKRRHSSHVRLIGEFFTVPRFKPHGDKFIADANKEYMEYSKQLAEKSGIDSDVIFTHLTCFIREAIAYAVFGDESRLLSQIDFLKKSFESFSVNR